MATRTLAFVGLDLRDMLLLKSMAEQAARRQGRDWHLADAQSADCIISGGEPPSPARPDALRVQIGAGTSDVGSRLLNYPPRLAEIATLLSEVDRRLNGAAAVPADSAGGWLGVIEQLNRCIARGQPFAMLDESGNGWTIYPQERQYTASGATELPPDHLRNSAASGWRLTPTHPASGRPRRALETLLWHLGMVSGAEGVLAPLDEDRPLRLRVWPYLLARAPRRFAELASLLRQGPCSARALREASAASAEEVAAFINACTLCGFAAPSSEASGRVAAARSAGPSSQPVRQAQGFTRFLGAIRHALGIPA